MNEVKEGLKHLEEIENKLEEIKEQTANPKIALRNGMLQGAGAVMGSILAVLLIGWLLSALGVIPGLGEVGQYLQNTINQMHTR